MSCRGYHPKGIHRGCSPEVLGGGWIELEQAAARQQPHLEDDFSASAATGNAEDIHDLAHIGLDGTDRDIEVARNLVVGGIADQQTDDFDLTWAEVDGCRATARGLPLADVHRSGEI